MVMTSVRSPIIKNDNRLHTEHISIPGPGNYDLTKYNSLVTNSRSIKIGL